MGRHGYSDDCDDPLAFGRWRAQVKSAMRGRRGQAFFKAMIEALDAMPVKELITEDLERDGEVCTLGALGRHRGIDLATLGSEDWDSLGATFDIAPQLAQEVMYENDEHRSRSEPDDTERGWHWRDETPSERWERIRRWMVGKLNAETAG